MDNEEHRPRSAGSGTCMDAESAHQIIDPDMTAIVRALARMAVQRDLRVERDTGRVRHA